MARVLTAMEGAQRRGVPEWAELNRDAFSGRVKLLPHAETSRCPLTKN